MLKLRVCISKMYISVTYAIQSTSKKKIYDEKYTAKLVVFIGWQTILVLIREV